MDVIRIILDAAGGPRQEVLKERSQNRSFHPMRQVSKPCFQVMMSRSGPASQHSCAAIDRGSQPFDPAPKRD